MLAPSPHSACLLPCQPPSRAPIRTKLVDFPWRVDLGMRLDSMPCKTSVPSTPSTPLLLLLVENMTSSSATSGCLASSCFFQAITTTYSALLCFQMSRLEGQPRQPSLRISYIFSPFDRAARTQKKKKIHAPPPRPNTYLGFGRFRGVSAGADSWPSDHRGATLVPGTGRQQGPFRLLAQM